MPVLHLGVLEVPYSFVTDEKTRRVAVKVARGTGRDRAPKTIKAGPSGGQTTGDVAAILEEKYGIMQFFFDHHAADIAQVLEGQMQGALDNLLMGAPVPDNPLAGAESRIQALFNAFLDAREMDNQVEGVPTKAAEEGKSSRFKKKKGSPRPSFIDSGLYEASFKAWIEP